MFLISIVSFKVLNIIMPVTLALYFIALGSGFKVDITLYLVSKILPDSTFTRNSTKNIPKYGCYKCCRIRYQIML